MITRPKAGFWNEWANHFQRGDSIQHMVQVVRSQTYQGNGSSRVTLNVDSGLARSVSSVMILGNDPNARVLGTTDDLGVFTPDDANDYIDKLSYSEPLGVRKISFQDGGKQIPDFRGISYDSLDPEAYVLGYQHQSPEEMTQVPSMHLYDAP